MNGLNPGVISKVGWVWSSGWTQSWIGLLLLTVTDYDKGWIFTRLDQQLLFRKWAAPLPEFRRLFSGRAERAAEIKPKINLPSCSWNEPPSCYWDLWAALWYPPNLRELKLVWKPKKGSALTLTRNNKHPEKKNTEKVIKIRSPRHVEFSVSLSYPQG